ncbi:hypothetical protein M9458_030276, partial [Cirrhinus mrigala]
DPVVTKGLSCLKSVIEDVKNTYITALLAYTFSLARDTDTRQQLFKKLEEVAISSGRRFVCDDFLLSFMTVLMLFAKLIELLVSLLSMCPKGSHLHWSQSGSAGDSDSLAVEISSYVLLAVLTTDSVTTADLGFANRIQNAYGGFSSTQ